MSIFQAKILNSHWKHHEKSQEMGQGEELELERAAGKSTS